MRLTTAKTFGHDARQVLKTPKQKRHIASDNVVFLRPLFSMVGRAANTTPEQSGNMPADFCRSLTPDRLPFASGQLPKEEQKIMTTPSRKPSVKLVHGKAVTTSLKIAEYFGKRHTDVLRAIQKLECSAEFRQRNFASAEYTDAQGKKRPMYTITRDGFAFLASGFTGKEAAQWKEKFIEAFNALEQHALEKAAAKRAPKALPPPQKSLPAVASELQTRINKRAWELAHAAYDEYRSRMMEDYMVIDGHTQPENWPDQWTPLETRKDVLESIFCAARIMEANANTLHNRGHRLAKLVGEDYVKVTAKFRPPKKGRA